MRSLHPDPSNPWPHDMVLSIEDRPNHVLELLWLREAYGLRPRVDDPPPALEIAPAPAHRELAPDVRSAWEEAWPRLWRATLEHAASEKDHDLIDRLGDLPPGSPERAASLQRLIGPSWGDELGPDAFDDPSWTSWEAQGSAAHRARRPTAYDEIPERRDLEALVPAWRAGLTRIVTIPCEGEHTRRLGAHGLLVTDATRAVSARYRIALESFAAASGEPG